jgi:hypothetical protein
VSAIAAVVSYFHALAVVQHAGARPPVAYLVPFLADLVILGASAALLDASRQDQSRPPLATVALVAGIGVTLAMNVAAGWGNGPAGAMVAGWPAAAFILALESLAGILRRGRGASSPIAPDGPPSTSSHPEPLSTEAALAALLDSASQRQLAELLGVPRSRIQAWTGRLDPVAGELPPGGVPDPPGAPGGATPPAGAATSDTVPAVPAGANGSTHA